MSEGGERLGSKQPPGFVQCQGEKLKQVSQDEKDQTGDEIMKKIPIFSSFSVEYYKNLIILV